MKQGFDDEESDDNELQATVLGLLNGPTHVFAFRSLLLLLETVRRTNTTRKRVVLSDFKTQCCGI